MRIIGNIEHPHLKITVFKTDQRISVKFENGLYEQIYKFREGEPVSDLEDVKSIVSGEFMESVLRQFAAMHEAKTKAINHLITQNEDDTFDYIL